MMRTLFRGEQPGSRAEFYLRRAENHLLVRKDRDGGVVVCATAANLTRAQRAAFIRYLRAEGFVADSESAMPGRQHRAAEEVEPSLRWIVDPWWPEADAMYAGNLRRLCWYATATMMIWLIATAILVCF